MAITVDVELSLPLPDELQRVADEYFANFMVVDCYRVFRALDASKGRPELNLDDEETEQALRLASRILWTRAIRKRLDRP